MGTLKASIYYINIRRIFDEKTQMIFTMKKCLGKYHQISYFEKIVYYC